MNAWISSLLIYIRVWLHVYAPFTTVSKRRADLHRMAVACVYSFMIARFVCTITSVRFFLIGCSYVFGKVVLQGCLKYLFSCKLLLHKHKLYGKLSQICYYFLESEIGNIFIFITCSQSINFDCKADHLSPKAVLKHYTYSMVLWFRDYVTIIFAVLESC